MEFLLAQRLRKNHGKDGLGLHHLNQRPIASGRESWRALTPQQGAQVLAELRTPWWIAGGWALDLYQGKVTRAHQDLDIGIPRKDAVSVIAALRGWEFFEAKDGVLTRLFEGKAPRTEVNSLWCRRAGAGHWELEFMLDECDGDFWVFRRDSRITRSLASVIRRNPEGIAYLAPEIQLLYKARATRVQDLTDFDRILPLLTREARSWLRESLKIIDPAHARIPMLEGLS